jgi:hypothetical protein
LFSSHQAKNVAAKKVAPSSKVPVSGKASTATWLQILGALVCTVTIPVFLVGVNMMCDKVRRQCWPQI